MHVQAWVLALAVAACCVYAHGYEDISTLEDDDFAEFEQFDADDELDNTGFVADQDTVQSTAGKPRAPPPAARDNFPSDDAEDDIIVEDEDNEFEHFQDPEEFEGFAESAPHSSEQPKITISKVPIMIRARWDAYWLEGILCCILAMYALGYALGRGKNTAIAANILKLHKPLLDDNFTLVGEAGADVTCGSECGWRREAEHCFTMWCSGRTCCEGMLLTLKLIKRQDLVHVVLNTVRPQQDTLQLRVELGKDDCEPFVLCIAQKKIATRLSKDMQDLSTFCGEKRPGDKHGLPASLSIMSETAEATAAVLDTRVTHALTQYATHVQYLHISDQYSGSRQQQEDTNVTKPPETQKVLMLSMTLSGEGNGEEVRPLMLLVFYLLEKLKRLRLSKEAMNKCERNRQRAAEAFVRGTHAARQEQAATRREERRKAEKERILAEDDPEKQRRWEKKEQKRQLKRKTPKMKQLKVKAL